MPNAIFKQQRQTDRQTEKNQGKKKLKFKLTEKEKIVRAEMWWIFFINVRALHIMNGINPLHQNDHQCLHQIVIYFF